MLGTMSMKTPIHLRKCPQRNEHRFQCKSCLRGGTLKLDMGDLVEFKWVAITELKLTYYIHILWQFTLSSLTANQSTPRRSTFASCRFASCGPVGMQGRLKQFEHRPLRNLSCGVLQNGAPSYNVLGNNVGPKPKPP